MNPTLTDEVETIEVQPERDLTVQDRCDRCKAQAYVAALKDDNELLFCGHHGRAHTPALAAGGWNILDFTDRINEKPSVSANV